MDVFVMDQTTPKLRRKIIFTKGNGLPLPFASRKGFKIGHAVHVTFGT